MHEFFSENLRKPARELPAGVMCQFPTGQVDSSAIVQGRGAREGHFLPRITVTSLIFNFSTRFFPQIVENRRGSLSRPFLSPGDNFSKSYDENRFRKAGPALNRARGI